MLSDHFEAPRQLARMRATCVGPYFDGFSTMLAEAGYSPLTIRGYLRAADHVGRWADHSGIDIRSWDDDLLVRFGRHLPRCKCTKANKGVFRGALASVRLLVRARPVGGGRPPRRVGLAGRGPGYRRPVARVTASWAPVSSVLLGLAVASGGP